MRECSYIKYTELVNECSYIKYTELVSECSYIKYTELVSECSYIKYTERKSFKKYIYLCLKEEVSTGFFSGFSNSTSGKAVASTIGKSFPSIGIVSIFPGFRSGSIGFVYTDSGIRSGSIGFEYPDSGIRSETMGFAYTDSGIRSGSNGFVYRDSGIRSGCIGFVYTDSGIRSGPIALYIQTLASDLGPLALYIQTLASDLRGNKEKKVTLQHPRSFADIFCMEIEGPIYILSCTSILGDTVRETSEIWTHMCSRHNFFPFLLCRYFFDNSLLLIMCTLRWYVKYLYRLLFLEDTLKKARVTQTMHLPMPKLVGGLLKHIVMI